MTVEDKTQTDAAREVSRAMVGLLKKYLGRGPSFARTTIDDDLVCCLLADTMTHAERVLKREDEEEIVRDLRRVFQGAFRDEAIALVEKIVGRPVLAFLSDHAVEPDYAVEVFVLESERGPEVGLDEQPGRDTG
jgi:uncharacterized protein YbcI